MSQGVVGRQLAWLALAGTLSLSGLPGVSPVRPATAQTDAEAPAASCEEAEGFDRLDFWVGEWDVFVGDRSVGHNRIEKILSGCAIMEHWTDARGSEGKSLFFYQPVTDTWKQVWVTQDATRPGGLKEKTLVEEMEDGGVRFRGEIPRAGGESYHDRTTLTPLSDGSVRQLIEVSGDGETWQSTFDARYVRAASGPGAGAGSR